MNFILCLFRVFENLSIRRLLAYMLLLSIIQDKECGVEFFWNKLIYNISFIIVIVLTGEKIRLNEMILHGCSLKKEHT